MLPRSDLQSETISHILWDPQLPTDYVFKFDSKTDFDAMSATVPANQLPTWNSTDQYATFVRAQVQYLTADYSAAPPTLAASTNNGLTIIARIRPSSWDPAERFFECGPGSTDSTTSIGLTDASFVSTGPHLLVRHCSRLLTTGEPSPGPFAAGDQH